jgi:hypothetical protein
MPGQVASRMALVQPAACTLVGLVIGGCPRGQPLPAAETRRLLSADATQSPESVTCLRPQGPPNKYGLARIVSIHFLACVLRLPLSVQRRLNFGHLIPGRGVRSLQQKARNRRSANLGGCAIRIHRWAEAGFAPIGAALASPISGRRTSPHKEWRTRDQERSQLLIHAFRTVQASSSNPGNSAQRFWASTALGRKFQAVKGQCPQAQRRAKARSLVPAGLDNGS